jgi:dienelactone hydrolase
MVPLTIDGEQVKLATITYKPPGNGPFPTLIFHHGSTGGGRDPALFARPYDPKALAGWFTARGWAVILPSRRGRGGSEGTYDEGFAPDRAQGYSCEPTLALAGADRALRDIDAITPVLLAQPFVDRDRVAMGGQSRGGILSVAWSGRQPAVPRAVVNFVGGWVSKRCWSSDEVNASLFRRGSVFDRPTIWLYGDNDPYYSLRHSRMNFAAFQAAGGKGAFHDYVPPEGLTGHQIAAAPELWTEALEAYLAGVLTENYIRPY